MSSRFIRLLIVIAVIGLVSYVFLLNPAPVTVAIGGGSTWTAPLALVLIVTFCQGVLLTALISLLFGIRSSFRIWREKQKNRLALDHLQQLVAIREQFAVRQYDAALPILRKMIAQDADNIVARNMLAEGLHHLGQKDAALRALDEARASQKRNLEWLFRGAEIHASLGNLTAACDNLVLVLHTEPNNRAALERLVDYSARLNRLNDSIEYQRRLMRVVSSTEAEQMQQRLAELELSALLEQNNGDDAQRKTAIEQFLKRFREYSPALSELARIERESTRLPQAEKLFIRAYRATPSSQILEELASMWLAVEQPEKALSAVRVALGPQNGKERAPVCDELFLVALLRHLEMNADAKRELERIKERSDLTEEDRFDISYLEALFLQRSGQYEEAVQRLEHLARSQRCNRVALFFARQRDQQSKDAQWQEESKLQYRALKQPAPELSTP